MGSVFDDFATGSSDPGKSNGGARPSPSGLRAMAAELADIRRIVTAAQAQSEILQRRTDVLSVTNSRLRRKLGSQSRHVEQARQFAYHDELTGLPNRTLLVDRLQQAMGQALRQRKRVALVLLNLDGFDSVDERFGPGSGEPLLRHVAGVLRASLRGSDTACRYGGAEFFLMLPTIDDIEDVSAVVRRIRARLSESYYVEGSLVALPFSAGLALYPGDGRDCGELLNRADVAMHQARASSSSPLASRALGSSI